MVLHYSDELFITTQLLRASLSGTSGFDQNVDISGCFQIIIVILQFDVNPTDRRGQYRYQHGELRIC